MLPNITNKEELQFLCKIYDKCPTFDEEYKDTRFGRLVHLTNHSNHIIRHADSGYLPIYEGKFIELYNGKYATFKGMPDENKYKNKATANLIQENNPDEYPESRFFIDKKIWENIAKNFDDGYVIAWRSLTSATNRRTMLATILPKIPTCQSIQILQPVNEEETIQILALFNSVIFDYVVRLKMAGLDLTQTVVKQIPVPRRNNYENTINFEGKKDSIFNHITARLEFLYRKDARVHDLFRRRKEYIIEGKNRKQVIAELDRIVGYAYGLSVDEIKRIAASFDRYYMAEEVEQWF